MSKHTPGPWTVFQVCGSIVVTESRKFGSTDGVEFLAIIEKGSDLDARLVAAAPEMLEALNLAEQFIANGVESGYIVMPEENDPALETLSKIRSAIKKTRGLA